MSYFLLIEIGNFGLKGYHSLEIKLQRELNFPRIAHRAGDPSERAGVNEIRERRNGEVRRIREVEELGPKLEVSILGRANVLENGEVKVPERRSGRLDSLASKRRKICLADSGSNRGIGKGGRVEKVPWRLLVRVKVLSRNEEGVTTESLSSRYGATDIEWLPILDC